MDYNWNEKIFLELVLFLNKELLDDGKISGLLYKLTEEMILKNI